MTNKFVKIFLLNKIKMIRGKDFNTSVVKNISIKNKNIVNL